MPLQPLPARKKHILLIEDEAPMRATLQRYITLAGYEVTSVASGAEGLKVLVALTPDLIMVDISLPELDGLVVLRELHEKFEKIKVVMMAAAADLPKAQQALNFGASDYLSKPTDLPTLKKTLQLHLPIK